MNRTFRFFNSSFFFFTLSFSFSLFFSFCSSCLRCWWPQWDLPLSIPSALRIIYCYLVPGKSETLLSLFATNFQKWDRLFNQFSKVHRDQTPMVQTLLVKFKDKERKITHGNLQMLLKRSHISKAEVYPLHLLAPNLLQNPGQLTLSSGVLWVPTSLPLHSSANLRGPCPESLISLDVKMIHSAKVHTAQHPPPFTLTIM